MGAECCPYKMFFLAAIVLLSLVGIGREMIQAGYLISRLYIISQSPKGLSFLGRVLEHANGLYISFMNRVK
jgi:hypothetical protein